MNPEINLEIVKAVALILSGVSLYTPFKIIASITGIIGQFGSDNEGKKQVMNKVLFMQWGGVIIFVGCYIITISLIFNIFGLIVDKYIFVFLILGGCAILIGIIYPVYYLKKRDEMMKINNYGQPLEVRVADFEIKITKLSDRIIAKNFYQHEAEDIRRQFMEERKVEGELYDKFLKLYNQLREKINEMDNMVNDLKKI